MFLAMSHGAECPIRRPIEGDFLVRMRKRGARDLKFFTWVDVPDACVNIVNTLEVPDLDP